MSGFQGRIRQVWSSETIKRASLAQLDSRKVAIRSRQSPRTPWRSSVESPSASNTVRPFSSADQVGGPPHPSLWVVAVFMMSRISRHRLAEFDPPGWLPRSPWRRTAPCFTANQSRHKVRLQGRQFVASAWVRISSERQAARQPHQPGPGFSFLKTNSQENDGHRARPRRQ